MTGVEGVGAVRPWYEGTAFVANEVCWLYGVRSTCSAYICCS